jgi:hypothetical protein
MGRAPEVSTRILSLHLQELQKFRLIQKSGKEELQNNGKRNGARSLPGFGQKIFDAAL